MNDRGRRVWALIVALALSAACGSKPAEMEVTPSRAALVQKRGRSVTLPLQGAEWLHANDHVDIVLSIADPQTKEWMALTVLQNSTVLEVGAMQNAVGDHPPLRNVTLLALPEEAELLLLSVRDGVATASLRNPEDIDIQEERGRATMTTLLTGERINTLLKKRTVLLTPPEKKE